MVRDGFPPAKNGKALNLKGSLFLFVSRSTGEPGKTLCLCGSLLFGVLCDNFLHGDDGWLEFRTILPPPSVR